MTAEAQASAFTPLIGYTVQMRRIEQVLANNTGNPLLVGEAAVGCEAIIEELARRIALGQAPAGLRDKQVFSLNLDALQNGARNADETANRMHTAIAEATSAKGKIVLFIGNAESWLGANAAHGADVAKFLTDSIAHGDLQIIGGTDAGTFEANFAHDATLAKMLSPVNFGGSTANEDQKSEKIADAANGDDANSNSFVGDKVSADLREMMQTAANLGTDKVRVILQADDLQNAELQKVLRQNGGRVKASNANLGSMSVEVPIGAVAQLAKHPGMHYISPDRPVQSFGHVETTTGATLVRNTISGTTLNGDGIGIAVLDSGVYQPHKIFGNNQIKNQIVYSQDFTGEGTTADKFGHGTHVAGLAIGSDSFSSVAGTYNGIAPRANVLNLRVLDSTGAGKVSNLLAALNWVMQNKATYNIRVVNMSLGTAAVDSYKNDPICKAVRQLVDAGVVVVAAAGNNGKNAAG
ncbi:MAG: hypothetical protein NVSMB56_15310 [Pyrinomonadaceae bacterium]